MGRRCADLAGILTPRFRPTGGTVARWELWAHGIYGNFGVDRSHHPDLHRAADECGAHECDSSDTRREARSHSRGKVATAIAAALALEPSEAEKMRSGSVTGYNEMQSAARRLAVRNGTVKTGIDVLEAAHFAPLHPGKGGAPRSIGLLTNQTGLDGEGRRTIDVLAGVPGISLDAIFSPEHGVTGTLDTTDVKNVKDQATGITVYSVYGGKDSARRPPSDLLKRLDAVVIDLADAGVRFYTYETTLGYFLEGAAKAGIEVVVLDRPNPITGSFVEGPVSEEGRESFTNYFAEPVRHGMTMGELARMFNAERQIGARLTVIPMEGWQRGDWFDSTGVAWVNPSPNLRDLNEAMLYPGVGMIEGANVSVGRGDGYPVRGCGRAVDQGPRIRGVLKRPRNPERALRAGQLYALVQ